MLSLEHRTAASPVITAPGISFKTFMGIQWAGAGFSMAFVAIRLVSRWHGPRRLFWDDGFAVFAAVLVFITACLWQWLGAADMYYVLDLQAGLVPVEADFSSRLIRYLKTSLISEIFFYATLFSVKISFILFFRRLGSNVSGQAYYRWPAFALSAICFVTSVGDMGFGCLVNSDMEYLTTYCSSLPFATIMTNAVTANCVLDVVSDLAITIIPFALLWNVRVPMRKKLAFVGLFSLTLVTIAAAIARAIETDVTKKANGSQDPSYVWMWGTIQASLAVIVSSLSSFPQLFAASSRKAKPQWTPTDTMYQRLRSRMQNRQARSADPLYDISAITFNDHDPEAMTQATSYDSSRPALRPDMGRNASKCLAVENPDSTQHNQIMRQVEYGIQVSEKPAASNQKSMKRPTGLGSKVAGPYTQVTSQIR